MPPINNNNDYEEWFYSLKLQVSQPFTQLLGEFVEAHNALQTLTSEAQRRGTINNAELYPALMKRDVAGAQLHDWLAEKVESVIDDKIARALNG